MTGGRPARGVWAIEMKVTENRVFPKSRSTVQKKRFDFLGRPEVNFRAGPNLVFEAVAGHPVGSLHAQGVSPLVTCVGRPPDRKMGQGCPGRLG